MSMSEGKSEPSVKIQNVVATGSLEHKIDIMAVHRAFVETEYRPETFPGLVFRLKKPKTSTLIFSSGKLVCTGAKSEKKAEKAIRSIIRKLKRRGIVIRGRPEIEIQNIVASGDLHGTIDLLSLYMKGAYEKGVSMMYEPEQFPGLIYRMRDPRAVLLLFASGKMVCTGTKKEMETYQAVEKVRRKLEDYDVIIYTRRRGK